MNTKDIIKQYYTEHPKILGSLIFLMFANVALTIGFPILLRYSVDSFSAITTNQDAQSLTVAIVLLCSLGVDFILMILTAIFKQKQITLIGSNLTSTLRGNAYNSIVRAEIKDLNDIDSNDNIKAICEDAKIIGNDYHANYTISMIDKLILSLTMLITIFIFSPISGLITLVTIPIFYFIYNLIIKHLAINNQNKKESTLQHQVYLKRDIENIKSVKIKNSGDRAIDTYKKISADVAKKDIKADFTKNNFLLIPVMFAGIIMIAAIAISIWLSNAWPTNPIEYGELGAVIISGAVFYFYYTNAIITFVERVSVKNSVAHIDSILDLRNESRSETIASLEEIHTLKFNNVSYFYDKNYELGIDGINFELKNGESLGILGYQKSGKTTIADLLIKIIKPKSGNILINNCDINKVSTKYLRGIVTYIPKYACLLDSTIEDNIIYPEIMDEYRYNDALNKCQLKELLMSLPNRDHELIRNIDLSKEEQTKIALASAIYKDSPIMVLDEATISMSEEKEKEILKEFYKLKNKIVIVINNHFSALENCDKIMIINKGKIVEYGDKDALVSNKKSVYSKMIKSDQKQAI